MLDLLKRLVAPDRSPEAPPPVGETPPVPGTTRPYVLWADGYDPPVIGLACPNCGGAAPKPPLLTVRYASPEWSLRFARVLRCPDCGCAFYERQKLPEYADDAMLRHGRVPYYLQQGAGISLIAGLLARTGRPAGSRYLDVGCGFGFGLDFAARSLGWRAQGIDPSPIAALGAEMLGVAIEPRYLGDDEPDLRHACDVVLASEVIEHVASPIGFVRTLRNVLRRGGILMLTTPDAGELRPQAAPGALAGLLAPGWHLIFQSRESLAALLRQAGFGHVEIDTDGYSLVAYASDRPLRLETDQAAVHAAYVGYLAARADDFPVDHDLRLGFAGRALQEAANDGDAAAGERGFSLVREACRVRFGLDLQDIVALPAEAATGRLERLAELMPLSLGCLLYADAMRRLAQGEARPRLEQRFLLAAEACDVLRRALGELAQEDALGEEVAWTARAEAALCAATAGSPDVVERVRALPPFPGPDEQQHRLIGERVLVALVNAGHPELGAALADAVGLQDAAWTRDADPASLKDVRRDALFCLAILDLRRSGPGDHGRAARRFALVRRQIVASGGLDAGRGLYWAAAQGEMQALERLGFADLVPGLLAAAQAEAGAAPDDVAATAARIAAVARAPDQLVALVNAGRYDEARLVAGALGDGAEAEPAEGPLPAAECDRLFSLAMLDLRLGLDAGRAARRFAAVRMGLPDPATAAAPVPDLYWAALRGEIEAISMADGADAAEALRTRALDELDHLDDEIPDDIRFGGVPA